MTEEDISKILAGLHTMLKGDNSEYDHILKDAIKALNEFNLILANEVQEEEDLPIEYPQYENELEALKSLEDMMCK